MGRIGHIPMATCSDTLRIGQRHSARSLLGPEKYLSNLAINELRC